MCNLDHADDIIPLHTFSGADAISGFYGQGKKSIFNYATKTPKTLESLKELGKNVSVTPDLQRSMEVFTMRVIYNDKDSKSRRSESKEMEENEKKKYSKVLDADSLSLHTRRASYEAFIWMLLIVMRSSQMILSLIARILTVISKTSYSHTCCMPNFT